MKTVSEAYASFWKNYFKFRGKTDRRSYWLAILCQTVVIAVLEKAYISVAGDEPGVAAAMMLGYANLALVLPVISATVRRLRDAGCGWGNVFWFFLSLPGWIVLVVKLCRKSAPEPEPVQEEAEPAEEPEMTKAVEPELPAAVTEKKPEPVPKPKPHYLIGKFYVFVAKGLAFGRVSGDIEYEKAEELYNSYRPAEDMSLEVVRPHDWGGNMDTQSSDGVALSTFNFEDFEGRMQDWLRKQGYGEKQISDGMAAYKDEGLHRINPFGGIYVMGVPIITQ